MAPSLALFAVLIRMVLGKRLIMTNEFVCSKCGYFDAIFHSKRNGTEQNVKAQMHILHGYWILTQIRIIELVRTRELLLNPILAY